ncbi:SDR family oxidoreductase [Xenorhabdus bovienii]|nr:oxidoreductase [Xenorhabdus bovienii]MCG3470208.1 SDR family oxidoreductase [Xenorhabdus bovienii]MDE9493192.1 SDR family oxidoreductase [Xenorhabdus bovienii]MDE9501728.1 SDR family oxidoreductase [Xenorhabdus bovienii]MDE9525512.1 SDR family oxidoreductase [Xenorhabdus bovienii]MDE9568051.1 SDR family oxidoreductase [Xenorhabdus bovienii]
MKRLSNKTIIITGGAGLIGKSFVKASVEEGAQVVIGEIDITKADLLIKELNCNNKEKIDIVQLDITNINSINECISYVSNKYGKIDALINNAYPRNSNYGKNFLDITYDDFCYNLSANVGGYFLCCQQFSKYFLKQGNGNIINIASIYGCIAPNFDIYEDLPITMPAEYAAIKSAIIHLSKYMAKLFKGKNIRVNCISPGGIFNNHDKKFIDNYSKYCLNKGMLDAKDLCGGLIYLLSDESMYINGQNLVIDDGFTL